jgi:hypothetical protein
MYKHTLIITTATAMQRMVQQVISQSENRWICFSYFSYCTVLQTQIKETKLLITCLKHLCNLEIIHYEGDL